MTDDDLTPRQRHQIAASKAGASAMRKRAALPVDRSEVFVVRDGQRFRWEIRRYGGVVVKRGMELFSSAGEARCAGEAALSAMLKEAAL